MATANAAWGIEIGAYAVKALRLERTGDEVEVSDYAVIPHKRVLCTPDINVPEVVRLTLGQLISQKQLDNELVVMSIPGHSSLVRFAKLPQLSLRRFQTSSSLRLFNRFHSRSMRLSGIIRSFRTSHRRKWKLVCLQ